jgi:hypothetical protein
MAIAAFVHFLDISDKVHAVFALIIEPSEPLDDLWAGLYREFERFDCLNVMPRLGCGAMTRGAERSRRDAEGRVESSDESKIGRYGLDL